MEVNEEKRNKFIEYAGKRVNNVMHDIQILEPMARSNAYDFTKEDVEEMFNAMQETLNDAKTEFDKKFEEKARAEKNVFSFGAASRINANANADSNAVPVETEAILEATDKNLEESINKPLNESLNENTDVNIIEENL